MKRKLAARVGDFMAGQGFYIVLFLCVAAIGISGYFLLNTLGSDPAAEAGRPTQVTVTSTPAPTPAQTAASTPEAKPSPTPAEEPSPAPAEDDPGPGPSASPVQSPTAFTWPVRGSVVGAFSLEVLAYDVTMGDWRVHSGVDIAAPLGAEVVAIAEGTVTKVYQDDLMGTTVVVDRKSVV